MLGFLARRIVVVSGGGSEFFGPEPSRSAPKQGGGSGAGSNQQQVATVRMHQDLLEIALDGRASGGRSRADVFCVDLRPPLATKLARLRYVGYVRVPDALTVT